MKMLFNRKILKRRTKIKMMTKKIRRIKKMKRRRRRRRKVKN